MRRCSSDATPSNRSRNDRGKAFRQWLRTTMPQRLAAADYCARQNGRIAALAAQPVVKVQSAHRRDAQKQPLMLDQPDSSGKCRNCYESRARRTTKRIRAASFMTRAEMPEPLGHQVRHYGMTRPRQSRARGHFGAPAWVLRLTCNAMPGVVLRPHRRPDQCLLFSQINDGNAIAMPVRQGLPAGPPELQSADCYRQALRRRARPRLPEGRAQIVTKNRGIPKRAESSVLHGTC